MTRPGTRVEWAAKATCIVRERHIRLHVVRLHREDIDHRVLSCRGPRPCRKAARPYASWLRQVEAYVGDVDVTGPASAWAMVRRMQMYRPSVDAATRCSGLCPHT